MRVYVLVYEVGAYSNYSRGELAVTTSVEKAKALIKNETDKHAGVEWAGEDGVWAFDPPGLGYDGENWLIIAHDLDPEVLE